MAATEYADLEIALDRWNADALSGSTGADSQPDSDVDIRLAPKRLSGEILPRVLADALDPNAYGTLLGANLFSDANVKQRSRKRAANTQAQDTPLRLRLFIDSAAPESLHALRWETLRDPTRWFLACDDGTHFV